MIPGEPSIDARQEPATHVVVVDDDVGIRDLLTDYLASHGYRAEACSGGAALDRLLARSTPDLIVLDLMMPGEDGLSICRRLTGGPPVIMLSAMGEETDRIVGLELGADDYLAKPCNPRELLARVRAVLRRRAGTTPQPRQEAGALLFAGWRLDLIARTLSSPRGHVHSLSGGEFGLLRAFAERPHRVLTREQLLDLARGPMAESFDRSIDVQISRLRKKLDDGSGRDLIVTLRGEGYRFAADVRPA